MQETASMKKVKTQAALARKKEWERKVRHQSRVEKLRQLRKVKEGRPLDDAPEDERAWLDW